MTYNEPIKTIGDSAVPVTGDAPVRLFTVRSRGNGGWALANNTGFGLYLYEAKSDENAPTPAQMIAAATLFQNGAGVQGGSRTGRVYAMLDAIGASTLYPQELSL